MAAYLPDDPEELKQLVRNLTATLEETQQLLQELLKARRGRQSEKLSADQLALFATQWQAQQAEKPAPDKKDQDGDPPAAPTGSSTPRGGRSALPKDLKRQQLIHDVAGKDQPCAACGSALRPIGEDRSERYEYVPAQVTIVEDICRKYACACQIHTAGKPEQPLPKSIAGASLLAYVIAAKYLHHLPLHRQQSMWAALGVKMSRKTMGGWLAQTALLLGPLYLELKKHVFASKVLGHDDTSVKVLDPQLDFARTGRFWPHCGDQTHPGVIFHYTPTRGAEGMAEFLAGFHGQYLQVDAYAAYNRLFADPQRGLSEVGCWAHARRYFMKALEGDRERIGPALYLIHELYTVESEARKLSPPDRLSVRRERSRPILDLLHDHLQRIRQLLLPKGLAARAVRYALNQWEALNRFCADGDLSIDNNATERALRGIAVGRRNWLFVGSDTGGQTAAVLLSFVASCRLVGVDVFTWFRDVLTRIAQSHPVNRLGELLPHAWQPLPA